MNARKASGEQSSSGLATMTKGSPDLSASWRPTIQDYCLPDSCVPAVLASVTGSTKRRATSALKYHGT